MLKKIINSLDSIPEELHKFYKESNGKFILQVEDDAGAQAIRALEKERDDHSKTKEKLREANASIEALEEAATKGSKTAEELERDISARHEKKIKKAEETIAALRTHVENDMINSTLNGIASIFTIPAEFATPMLRNRVRVDFDDNMVPKLVVLDEQGKATVATVEEFKRELVDNPRFEHILKGSQASGSGASGGGSGGGSGGTHGEKKRTFGELSDTERTAWFRRDPIGFNRASEEWKNRTR